MAENFDTQGDAICENCGADNPIWLTDNDSWNAIHPGGGGILCPNCFIGFSDALAAPIVWRVVPERGSASNG